MGRVRALLDGRDHGWIRKSMLVTAWQSAGPGLDVSSLDLRSWVEQLADSLAGGPLSERECDCSGYCSADNPQVWGRRK